MHCVHNDIALIEHHVHILKHNVPPTHTRARACVREGIFSVWICLFKYVCLSVCVCVFTVVWVCLHVREGVRIFLNILYRPLYSWNLQHKSISISKSGEGDSRLFSFRDPHSFAPSQHPHLMLLIFSGFITMSLSFLYPRHYQDIISNTKITRPLYLSSEHLFLSRSLSSYIYTYT